MSYPLPLLLLACLSGLIFSYEVGVGIYDVTGPSVEINFMGYAVPKQRGSGIHLRLRARTFIMKEDAADSKRIVYVNVDGGMASDMVKFAVIDKLKATYGENLYTDENVAISGTHTHSGPGGFLQYVLYQTTSWGFVKETFDAWVNGIYESIVRAHDSIEPVTITINEDLLFDANINRSPTSYILNPIDEQDMYAEEGDTDKKMTLLKFISSNGGEIKGVLNWFAVHGTSMNNTNTLISGDNKGYASAMLEKELNGPSALAGQGPVVGAFASSNLGDVSPNTKGPKCIDTGEDCDGTTSTCNGKCENCIASGPGIDMEDSCKIIGDRQYQKALELIANKNQKESVLSGPVDYRHSYVQMEGLKVNVTDMLGNKKETTLCTPAMGYSFAAGTTDGPGMFNFEQHETTPNKFWNRVRDALSKPTQAEEDCQAPKPILLNTGNMDKPYAWDPSRIPLQLLRLGNLFIVCVPSELTTMAGRRVRKIVMDIVKPLLNEGEEGYIVISGLTNTYSSYVVTLQEYQAQRYEAASTIYGQYTLQGYQQELSRLATDMLKGVSPSETEERPKNSLDDQIEMALPVILDRHPKHVKFGDVVTDTDSTYVSGDTIKATFQAANPRNDQKINESFLKVEKKGEGDAFTVVKTDGDWETKFHWKREIGGESTVTLEWNTDVDTELGQYRMCYHGDHKMIMRKAPVPFSGCSSVFTIQ